MRSLVIMLFATTATPAIAQDHSGHSIQSTPAATQTECEKEAARHRAMGHPVPDGACAPVSTPSNQKPAQPVADHSTMDHSKMDHSTMDHSKMDQSAPDHGVMDHSNMDHGQSQAVDHSSMDHGQTKGMDHSSMNHGAAQDTDHSAVDHGAAPPVDHSKMDHSKMDHSKMDHSKMDHSQMNHGAAPTVDHSQMDHGTMEHNAIPVLPSPAAAGSGPPRAADAIWGADAMRHSRDKLRQENGGMTWFWFQGDRFEYQAREGHDGYLWDVQGYYGGDIDKLWFKSEGEGSFGEEIESADIQALWSHAIGPWWDVQAGVRQDLTGPKRTHAVIGVQGMSPYLFEVDAAAFLSTKGDLTASVEAELDQRITQRLILQPRAEVVLSAQDVPELGIGAGLDSIEAGLRLRYEIAREFAPYIGIGQEWKIGRSANYARLAGDDSSVTNYVFGVRFWF